MGVGATSLEQNQVVYFFTKRVLSAHPTGNPNVCKQQPEIVSLAVPHIYTHQTEATHTDTHIAPKGPYSSSLIVYGAQSHRSKRCFLALSTTFLLVYYWRTTPHNTKSGVNAHEEMDE